MNRLSTPSYSPSGTFFFPLLQFTFVFSFISVQLTFWNFYLTNEYTPYYFALAIIYYFIIISIIFKYKFETYDKKIILITLYLTTIPIITSAFNLRDIQMGLQAVAVPFILYFFLRFALNSHQKIYKFMRLIVYVGGLAVFYIIFEQVNRLTLFWPGFFETLMIFLQKHRIGLGYLEDQMYGDKFIVRPMGIFFDLHSQGFIILTAFLIVFCLGDSLFKNKYVPRLLMGLMLFGIILSTVKTYILILIGLIFLSFLINRKYISTNKMENRKRSPVLFSVFIIVIAMFFFRDIFVHLCENIGVSSQGTGTSGVIKEHVFDLIMKEIPGLFVADTFHALFGFGYGHSAESVMGGEAHFLGSHLAKLGIVGTFLYWGLFVRVIRECFRSIKRSSKQGGDIGLFLLGFLICITLMLTLLHFSPLNVCGNFIAAFILFIGNLAFRHNRKLDSAFYK